MSDLKSAKLCYEHIGGRLGQLQEWVQVQTSAESPLYLAMEAVGVYHKKLVRNTPLSGGADQIPPISGW